MSFNILAVGDVRGDTGLEFLEEHLRSVKSLYGIEFCVVNGENASGKGRSPQQAEAMLSAGADVGTLGNHAFNRRNGLNTLDENPYIIRPANFAPQTPGRGWGDYDSPYGKVRVINLIGRCGMLFGPDNPFFEADRILKNAPPKFVLVDFHAEATSEKAAMGYYLDGRVSAVWGTHTHVQTSDGRVLPKGTGFITDLGMTGPVETVIGIKPEQSIPMFLGNPPERHDQAPGPCKLEAAIVRLDGETGLCREVEAIRIM